MRADRDLDRRGRKGGRNKSVLERGEKRWTSKRTVYFEREGGKEIKNNEPEGHLGLGREKATAYGLFAAGELLDARTNPCLAGKGKGGRE